MIASTFEWAAGWIALAIEGAAVLLIATGAAEAFGRTSQALMSRAQPLVHKKEIWVRFASWLMLGLEFELAADLVRTAISPTWNAIGQLGAIATIRTLLNYFLGQDITEYLHAQTTEG